MIKEKDGRYMAYKIIETKKPRRVNLGQGKLKKADYEGIDRSLVKSLCEIQCTNEEIASVVGVSVSTIERHFDGELQGWRYFGHSSLRRAQWRKALYNDAEGDTSMLKHLGKVYLKQGDDSTEFSQRPFFQRVADELDKSHSKPMSE